ncbi:MAG: hypothetical protein QOJ65_708 [Fimbriimonadaceae bacterium]|jgi:hypothetical protein|nr:hypothetical protein [Fimbriimonadaceae bacterium]
MLQFLPALILLLLNGPANTERLAERGALPAALAGIQKRIDTPGQPSLNQRRAERMALASLLSLSSDPQVSHALARIFSLQMECEQPAPAQLPGQLEERTDPPPREECLGQPQDGFLGSQRSRDGPISR